MTIDLFLRYLLTRKISYSVLAHKIMIGLHLKKKKYGKYSRRKKYMYVITSKPMWCLVPHANESVLRSIRKHVETCSYLSSPYASIIPVLVPMNEKNTYINRHIAKCVIDSYQWKCNSSGDITCVPAKLLAAD